MTCWVVCAAGVQDSLPARTLSLRLSQRPRQMLVLARRRWLSHHTFLVKKPTRPIGSILHVSGVQCTSAEVQLLVLVGLQGSINVISVRHRSTEHACKLVSKSKRPQGVEGANTILICALVSQQVRQSSLARLFDSIHIGVQCAPDWHIHCKEEYHNNYNDESCVHCMQV